MTPRPIVLDLDADDLDTIDRLSHSGVMDETDGTRVHDALLPSGESESAAGRARCRVHRDGAAD